MKKILISSEPWQTRVAVLAEKKLQDVYFESKTDSGLERTFFKGRILKVLPGIQTAFVDIGMPKAGFLHITEIDRALAVEKIIESRRIQDDAKECEEIERNIKHEMKISQIFNEGDEVLVQVLKEPTGEKGPKLTTCFALPGKFVVLMPNIPQIGVSKKIEQREERYKLKEVVLASLPQEMGAIIRTTAEGRSAANIKKDLAFLMSIWRSVQKKFKKAKVGDKIHQDLPLALRAVREHLDEDTELVVCDSEAELANIQKFVKHYMPELINKVRLYTDSISLFDNFDIDHQIEEALQKKVLLKSGGSIVIESTEAMAVIDVNTGKFIGKDSHEDTILKTNMEAAEEIVRQLRLRNIGGLIVIDFIDMAHSQNRQKLSRFLERMLKERDRFQSVALKISEFGLVQMTRKRSGKTLAQQLTTECGLCHGAGSVLAPATQAFRVLHAFRERAIKEGISGGAITLQVAPVIFGYLVHHEFTALLTLEKEFMAKIILESSTRLQGEAFMMSTSPAKS